MRHVWAQWRGTVSLTLGLKMTKSQSTLVGKRMKEAKKTEVRVLAGLPETTSDAGGNLLQPMRSDLSTLPSKASVHHDPCRWHRQHHLWAIPP